MNVKIKFPIPILVVLFFLACKSDVPQNIQEPAGVVRVRSQAGFSSLNPYAYRSVYEVEAIQLMYLYPLQFNPENLKLSPQLAKSLPTVEEITEGEYAGGRVFSFEFFEEAVWADGRPVTGYDYAFTMKVIFNPRTNTQRFAAYIDYLRDVVVDENNPKKFKVYTANPYLIDMEALSNYIILPKHFYDPEGLMDNFNLKDLTDREKAAQLAESDDRLQQFADAFDDPKFSREAFLGSGPYTLTNWVEGQSVVFERKKDWWGDNLAVQNPMLRAYPQRIEYIPIEDNGAAMTALKDLKLDVLTEVDSKDFVEAKKEPLLQANFDFYTPTRLAFFYTTLNNDQPKLGDKRVRRALAHCLDLEEVIRVTYEGFGERVVGPFLPDKSYYHSGLELIQKDLEKGKSLLADAGWEDTNNNGIVDKVIDGKKTELSLEYLFTPTIPFQRNLSKLMMDGAKQIGIEITPTHLETRELAKRIRSGDYEITGRGASSSPVPDDPKQFWHCDSARPGGSNYSRFCIPEADVLIEEIRTTSDHARRDELYKQLQEIIYDEQPMIFLFSPKNKVIVSKQFKDPLISKLSLGISLQHLRLGNEP